MRALAIAGFSAALALIVATPALAQTDGPGCPKGPGGGGMVGGVNRVTKQIPGGDCPNQAPKETDQDCTSMRLEYAPAAIPYRREGVGTVTYAPTGCRQPPRSPDFQLSDGSREIFLLGVDGRVFILSNTASTATIQATHGSLPAASATVNSVPRPKCTEMRLAYEPPTIHINETAAAEITFLPQDCVEPGDWFAAAEFTSTPPRIGSLEGSKGSGGYGTIRGISEGTARITASLANLSAQATVDVVNTGPDCKTIALDYPDSIPLGAATAISASTGISPLLKYAPEPCKRPSEAIQFEAITPALVKVASDSGIVTALKVGTARVGVTHGTLHSIKAIKIIPVPTCDRLLLTYDPDPLMLHVSAAPRLEYTSEAASLQFAANCTKPDGEPRFSAETLRSHNDVPAVELARDGTVKGVAVGLATVKVTHAALQGSRLVTVADGKPCEKIQARYVPAAIQVGQTARLVVSYEPQSCVPPSAPVQAMAIANSAEGEVDLDAAGNARGKSVGLLGVSVEQGETFRGVNRAYASIEVLGLRCTGFAVRADPPTIKLDERAWLLYTFTPDGCQSHGPSYGWFVLAGDGLKVEPSGTDQSDSVIGIRGGEWTVTVRPPARWTQPPTSLEGVARVVVEAPACTDMSLSYSITKLRTSTNNRAADTAWPTLKYSPDRCRRPTESVTFTSETRNLPVDERGKVTVSVPSGEIVSHYTVIHAKHGDLTAEAALEWVDDFR